MTGHGRTREGARGREHEGREGAGRERDERQRDVQVDGIAEESPTSLARRFVAELLGTFALTFVAAGAEVAGRVTGGEVDHVSRAVAPGLLVGAFIYAVGDVSGAHFNPAVTLAFVVRRLFPAALAPLYWVAQLAGAVCAALLLRALFGDAAAAGVSRAHASVGVAVTIEVALTWLLVTVILGTADRARIVGPNAALAVGATIALCGLFAGPISGASMNPARSLGPALVNGELGSAWLYVVGPIVGALLAVGSALLLHSDAPAASEKSVEAASGDGNEGEKNAGERNERGEERADRAGSEPRAARQPRAGREPRPGDPAAPGGDREGRGADRDGRVGDRRRTARKTERRSPA